MRPSRRPLWPEQQAQVETLLSAHVERLALGEPVGDLTSGDAQVDAEVRDLVTVFRLLRSLAPRLDPDPDPHWRSGSGRRRTTTRWHKKGAGG